MVTVAMATAAAPLTSRSTRTVKRMFADGGVWANNPVMIGLVDALACYQLQRRQVHILSLGTATPKFSSAKGRYCTAGLGLERDHFVGDALARARTPMVRPGC